MSFILLLLTSAVLGRSLTLGVSFEDRVERVVISLLVGLAICAAPLVLIGSYSLRWTSLVLVALLVGSLVVGMVLQKRYVFSRLQVRPEQQPAWSGLEKFSAATVGLVLLLTIFTALAPATAWDACVAHLALPATYVREGRFFVYEGNAYSAYPHLLHVLFTVAFQGGGERCAQILGWIFSSLACGSAYLLGKRLYGRKEGLIAAAVFATAPVFIDQAGTASLDLAFTAYTLAALAAFASYVSQKNLAWLFVSALLAGSSCGIRHTGYLVALLLTLGSFGVSQPMSSRFQTVFLFGTLVFLSAFPWLLRSTLTVHAPFYPFFMSSPVSTLPDADITALGKHESIRSRGFWGFITFPWTIIMYPERFDGWQRSPGGVVLALGIPGIGLGGLAARYLALFSAVGVGAFYFFQQQARYMLPFFAPMMVVAAVGATRLISMRRLIHGVLYFSYLFGMALAIGAVHFRIPAATGLEPREEFLKRRVERYDAFAWANEHLPRDGCLLLLDPRSYYYRGCSYQNPESIKVLIGMSLEEQVAWLRSRNIRYVMLPQAYLEESPGFRETGLLQLFQTWESSPQAFPLIKRLELPRVRGVGTERVDFREVRDVF
ncbi:MAG TPA: glycosyltransferase family 39 protein [Candidatus Hydrogenedentes bacterium]|nr:glycosyltransferase family 39 protein [Candidatus Hydrogenedentota bacterium]